MTHSPWMKPSTILIVAVVALALVILWQFTNNGKEMTNRERIDAYLATSMTPEHASTIINILFTDPELLREYVADVYRKLNAVIPSGTPMPTLRNIMTYRGGM